MTYTLQRAMNAAGHRKRRHGYISAAHFLAGKGVETALGHAHDRLPEQTTRVTRALLTGAIAPSSQRYSPQRTTSISPSLDEAVAQGIITQGKATRIKRLYRLEQAGRHDAVRTITNRRTMKSISEHLREALSNSPRREPSHAYH